MLGTNVTAPTLLVEGWRFIPHSYACVNMWQLLELSCRPDINLLHRDIPMFCKHWRQNPGLLDAPREKRIAQIPPFQEGGKADFVYRIFGPLRFLPDQFADKTFIFATTEYAYLKPESVSGDVSIEHAFLDGRLHMLTPSNWAKFGMLRSGIPEERVSVLPLGVDSTVFKPLSDDERSELRARFGWQDRFVFLHIGAMTGNKGIDSLIQAFASVALKHPEAILYLKGSDGLFNSRKLIDDLLAGLAGEIPYSVVQRIYYSGDVMSCCDLANCYQAADAYVSPYKAEGFNLPVLEAIACGLPVICTQGGPTDDFTNDLFALTISSKLKPFPDSPYLYLEPDIDSLIQQMITIINDKDFCILAKCHGPAHVKKSFSWQGIVDRLLAKIMA